LPAEQAFYLNYYKLGSGPYYLLYRPYHLCHLETPKAIKRAANGSPLLSFDRKVCEVYAYAKRPLAQGEVFSEAIGSAEVYGMVAPIDSELVPIALLENKVLLKKTVTTGRAITWDDVSISPCVLLDYWEEQNRLTGGLT